MDRIPPRPADWVPMETHRKVVAERAAAMVHLRDALKEDIPAGLRMDIEVFLAGCGELR